MKATVVLNTEDKPARHGFMEGMVFKYHTRHGIPVFFMNGAPGVRGLPQIAQPGMIGIGLTENQLYTVMPDSTIMALPLKVEPVTNSLAEIA